VGIPKIPHILQITIVLHLISFIQKYTTSALNHNANDASLLYENPLPAFITLNGSLRSICRINKSSNLSNPGPYGMVVPLPNCQAALPPGSQRGALYLRKRNQRDGSDPDE
jgi:hypothetical protein